MAGVVHWPGAEIPHVRAVQGGPAINLAWAAANPEVDFPHRHHDGSHGGVSVAAHNSFEAMFRGHHQQQSMGAGRSSQQQQHLSFASVPTANEHERNANAGVAVAADMMDQIRKTKAQLDVLSRGAREDRLVMQQQQQQQQQSFQQQFQNDNRQQQQARESVPDYDFTGIGRISNSWDVVASSPRPGKKGGVADDESPTRDLYGSLSPMSPSQQHQQQHADPLAKHFSVSPLPRHAEEARGQSPSPLPANASSSAAAANKQHNTSTGSAGSNTSNGGGARPPWNYRAGKAVIAKDADPAAAAVNDIAEHATSGLLPAGAAVATAPSASKAVSGSRFDTPDRRSVGAVPSKKTSSSTTSNAADEPRAKTTSSAPRRSTSAPRTKAATSTAASSAASVPPSASARSSPAVPASKAANATTAAVAGDSGSNKPVNQKSVGHGVTARTFFPSPMRNNANSNNSASNVAGAPQPAAEEQSKKRPPATLSGESNGKTESAKPSPKMGASSGSSKPSTPRGSSGGVFVGPSPAIAAAFSKTSKSPDAASASSAAAAAKPKALTEDDVNNAIRGAVTALETRLQRQEAEMHTLRNEHVALQMAHNALRGQHTDLVEFVRLQLDELRLSGGGGAASDVGVGSCCGRSDTTEGTQRALALLEAEVEGATPPLSTRAKMTASQQQAAAVAAAAKRQARMQAQAQAANASLRAASSAAGMMMHSHDEAGLMSDSPRQINRVRSPSSNANNHNGNGNVSSASSLSPASRVVTTSRLPPSPPMNLVHG